MDKGKQFVRVLIGFIVFLYVIVPDFFPGPIDDAVLILFGLGMNNRLKITKDENI